MQDRKRDASTSPSSFDRLDATLSGHGPRTSPEGLRYEDPVALYRAEMARVALEGLVN